MPMHFMSFPQRTAAATAHLCGMAVCMLSLLVVDSSSAEKHTRAKPWLVKAVTFTGNPTIASSVLLSGIATKPSRLFHKVKFSKLVLASDCSRVVEMYHDSGFLDIVITADDVVKDKSSRKVAITIDVQEGPRTFIDSLAIHGGSILGEEGIAPFVWTKLHGPYSVSRLANDIQCVRDSSAARGYPFSRVESVAKVDTVSHRATVTIVVDQGPLAVAGSLAVSGEKKLHTVIIERGLSIHTGDTLTSGHIQSAVNQMYETGMFKGVDIAIPIADSLRLRQMKSPLLFLQQKNLLHHNLFQRDTCTLLVQP